MASGQWPCSHINSRPTRGNTTFQFELNVFALNAALLIGVDNTAWDGGLLPLDLTPLGAPGCALGTSVEALLPTAFPNHRVSATLPDAPVTLYTQWIIPDPVNALGVVLSDARRIEIR